MSKRVQSIVHGNSKPFLGFSTLKWTKNHGVTLSTQKNCIPSDALRRRRVFCMTTAETNPIYFFKIFAAVLHCQTSELPSQWCPSSALSRNTCWWEYGLRRRNLPIVKEGLDQINATGNFGLRYSSLLEKNRNVLEIIFSGTLRLIVFVYYLHRYFSFKNA